MKRKIVAGLVVAVLASGTAAASASGYSKDYRKGWNQAWHTACAQLDEFRQRQHRHNYILQRAELDLGCD